MQQSIIDTISEMWHENATDIKTIVEELEDLLLDRRRSLLGSGDGEEALKISGELVALRGFKTTDIIPFAKAYASMGKEHYHKALILCCIAMVAMYRQLLEITTQEIYDVIDQCQVDDVVVKALEAVKEW